MSKNTMLSDNAGEPSNKKTNKVNLSEIKSNLVKRGKPPYENAELATDILDIDPLDSSDAFIWVEAKVNLNQEPKKIQSDKMKFRNRAETVAEKVGVVIQINWMDNGEMVISRKANA